MAPNQLTNFQPRALSRGKHRIDGGLKRGAKRVCTLMFHNTHESFGTTPIQFCGISAPPDTGRVSFRSSTVGVASMGGVCFVVSGLVRAWNGLPYHQLGLVQKEER